MSDTEEATETKRPRRPSGCCYPAKCPSRTFLQMSFKSNRFLVQTTVDNWPAVKEYLRRFNGFKLLVATCDESHHIYAFVVYRHSVEIGQPEGFVQFAKAFTTYWQNMEYICCKGPLYDNVNFEPKWTSDSETGEVNGVLTRLAAKDVLAMSKDEAEAFLTVQDYLAYCNLKNNN